MTSGDAEFDQKVKLQSIELFADQGKDVYKDVSEISMFNQKLIGTLAAGAIVTILTLITRKEGNHSLNIVLVSYLNSYLLVLALSVINAALRYIQAFALAEHFDHQHNELQKSSYLPSLEIKTRSRENLINILSGIMILIHIAAVIIFFVVSCCLIQEASLKL